MEGQEPRVKKVWQDLAASEMRIRLMRELGKFGVGFGVIKNFGINLRGQLRSGKQKKRGREATREDALMVKMKDEQRYNEELVKRRNEYRKEIENKLGDNSRPYRRKMAWLREEGEKVKMEQEEKYGEKIKNLTDKFKKEEEEKENQIPDEIKEYADIKVFSKENFKEIKIKKY